MVWSRCRPNEALDREQIALPVGLIGLVIRPLDKFFYPKAHILVKTFFFEHTISILAFFPQTSSQWNEEFLSPRGGGVISVRP